MNKIIRSWATRVVGENLLQAITCRIRVWLRFRDLNRSVYNKLFKDQPLVVQTGPFKGMRYTRDLVWGVISNKWLGTYEAELHETVEEIITSHYSNIIDVGCAEGWYAVGLAYRISDCRVYVFDRDPISLWQCRHLAKVNGLEKKIITGSNFDAQHPPSDAGNHTLLICDIEGAEMTLLNPYHAPRLHDMDILVEVHEPDASKSKYADLLHERFCHTHQVHVIKPYTNRGRKLVDTNQALVEKLGEPLFLQGADEYRAPGNHWLWMKRLLD